MLTVSAQIDRTILSHTPIVYMLTPEEMRMENLIREKALQDVVTVYEVHEWSVIRGLDGDESTCEPVLAIKKILKSGKAGFYIFKDLSSYMNDAKVMRALREFYYSYDVKNPQAIFVLASELVIPDAIKKEIHLIEVPPPNEEEIRREFQRLQTFYGDVELSEQDCDDIILAMKGLTISEIDNILHRIFKGDKKSSKELISEIFSEKQMIVKKSGYMEFHPPTYDLSSIGGLDNLKEWLNKRQKTFTREAVQAGMPIPKGLLIMGVSGCGKSLAIKAISALWNVPLFRLDMNLVFSGLFGSPEATFHKTLQTIEAVSPAILWIDEIENALGIEEDGLSISSHIFSSFLTWMQEKPPLVFIAATANKIHALPAEILRKGRFDQVFFVDLPNEQERKDIFTIHLKKYGADSEQFDLNLISIMTKGWNGAEIEQCVIAARTDAFFEQRTFSERDITANIGKIIPLSETMEKQIKSIRSWAFSRAVPATKSTRSHR